MFSRAVIEDNTGLSTGLLNNFGDLPFHLSVITSFAFGNNFPPEDPTYAGVRFTYPFISDFVSAVFVRCGADLRESMFIENYILGLAFVGLVHRWALVMLRDRLAAIITPLMVLLNGGLGWTLLFEKAGNKRRRTLRRADGPAAFVHCDSGDDLALGQCRLRFAGPATRISDGTSAGGDCLHAMVDRDRQTAAAKLPKQQRRTRKRKTKERLARAARAISVCLSTRVA